MILHISALYGKHIYIYYDRFSFFFQVLFLFFYMFFEYVQNDKIYVVLFENVVRYFFT